MQLEKHKNKSEAPNYPPPILSSGCEFNCTRNVLFLVYFVCVCVCVCVFLNVKITNLPVLGYLFMFVPKLLAKSKAKKKKSRVLLMLHKMISYTKYQWV